MVKYSLVVGIAVAGALVLVNLYAAYRQLQKARIAPAGHREAVRRPVPAFQALDQQGRGVTLESLKGKV